MRNILLVALITALSVWAAKADPLSLEKPGKVAPLTATTDKPLPAKRSDARACAAFGPNFVKVNGSETCVKVGGTASVSVGGAR